MKNTETTNPVRSGRFFNPLALGLKAKPTLKHRPAIWECMLGTVYAMNDDGDIKYFDYDYDAAMEFAGIDLDEPVDDYDLRTAKPPRRVRYGHGRNTCPEPSQNQKVLWIKKETN